MADDGMILNFTAPTGPILPKTILIGGPWRERRKVARQQKENVNDVAANSVEQRPIKRQKLSNDSYDDDLFADTNQNHQNWPEKPVISSLFTSNPQSKTKLETTDPTAKKAEPSNAPLTSAQATFTNLGLFPKIAIHLTEKLLISAPTAIQEIAIPALLKNETDVFIQAQTGSGKTLAYLLPIIHHILTLDPKNIHRDSGLFAIILAPTRELCKQIAVVLNTTLRFTASIVAGNVMGGEKKQKEKSRLRKGLNILVATPGRLADHLKHTEVLDLTLVRWLVLDEGDRLVELGFEDDIKMITSMLDFRLKNPSTKSKPLESLPCKRINILCSATLRPDVERLGEISLRDAQHITLADNSNTLKPFTVPAQLKQQYVIVPAKLRLVTLHALIKRSLIRATNQTRIIVFLSCADSVDFHYRIFTKCDSIYPETSSAELSTSGIAKSLSSDKPVIVFRLHGSLTQAIRTSTLAEFSKCSSPAVLLSTDIASRGLDLPNVDRVIECDPAFSREEHLHRVGRTARAGNDGQAVVFLMPGCEEGYIEVLKSERDVGETGVGLKGLSAEQILRSSFPESAKSDTEGPQTWDTLATAYQLEVERWILESPTLLESARKAYQSHIRAYTTHVKNERDWFDIKQLHLGHLAKAFGLRDRPGNVNVPGMRASVVKVKSDRKRAGVGAGSRNQENIPPSADADIKASRNKMMKMSRMMGVSANEFNLA